MIYANIILHGNGQLWSNPALRSSPAGPAAMLVNPPFLDLIRLSIRFSSAKVAEINNDLLDTGDIKLQRHQITASMLSNIERGLVRAGPIESTREHEANLPTLFVSTCISLTDRVKSRDLIDLWRMTHENGLPLTTQSIFETIQLYRPRFPYEHARHRLLDWEIPAQDEWFHTVESIRDSFRGDVNRIEIKMTVKARSELDEGRI